MHELNRACVADITEDILTHLVADCGGTVHDSGGESAVGAGTAE